MCKQAVQEDDQFSVAGKWQKNQILLDFLVRSKNYIFLETLGHNKKNEYSVQFFFGHFVDFQDLNIMTSCSMVSQKSNFPKCHILYINRKII